MLGLVLRLNCLALTVVTTAWVAKLKLLWLCCVMASKVVLMCDSLYQFSIKHNILVFLRLFLRENSFIRVCTSTTICTFPVIAQHNHIITCIVALLLDG